MHIHAKPDHYAYYTPPPHIHGLKKLRFINGKHFSTDPDSERRLICCPLDYLVKYFLLLLVWIQLRNIAKVFSILFGVMPLFLVSFFSSRQLNVDELQKTV